jgi:hypothetical protein
VNIAISKVLIARRPRKLQGHGKYVHEKKKVKKTFNEVDVYF